jgi:hypothetical protein
MIFKEKFDFFTFEKFLINFLPDFIKQDKEIIADNKSFEKVKVIGYSKLLDLNIIFIKSTKILDKRIITKEMFNILTRMNLLRALIVFVDDDSLKWRLSLLNIELNLVNNKVEFVKPDYSKNTFLFGVGEKFITAKNMLLDNGIVKDFDDLKYRFSIELLNITFYKQVSMLFQKLIGGKRLEGKKIVEFKGSLKIKGTVSQDVEHQEFSVRLIGRLIFVWFLKHKLSANRIPVIEDDIVSLEKITKTKNVYNVIIEPLFFELLNKSIDLREDTYRNEKFDGVPYLNGGLFKPQLNDYYKQNLIKIDDDWFIEIIELFNIYSFTIDENDVSTKDISIDPEMLGRIFENLLAEINPDTGESARKSTGSFYTPKKIVDYMVNQSIFNYLKNNLDLEESIINDLIDNEINLDNIDLNKRKMIFDKVINLKILDPASGSGAFPLGILNKLNQLLKRLDSDGLLISQKLSNDKSIITSELKNKSQSYKRKYLILKNCIHGVDIQPIATEIARLRSFLTLIVEEVVDEKLKNKGIEPLPNLDFKFITANTLMKLENSSNDNDLFKNDYLSENLQKIKKDYFIANSRERIDLSTEFARVQKLMLAQIKDEFKGLTSLKYQKLSSWKPFDYEVSSWFDPGWMFGVETFDIVIMNPPYVSNKKIAEKDKILFKESFGFSDDLYNIFFFRSYQFLGHKGILTVISSDTYFTLLSKSNLRKLLLSKSICEIAYLGHNIFETAMVSTAIIIISNQEKFDNLIKFLDARKAKNLSLSLKYIVNQNEYKDSINESFFVPNELNLRINNLFSKKHKNLKSEFGHFLLSSKNGSRNLEIIEDYLENLKVNDFTLIGLVTKSAVGLQTGDNGYFLGVKASSNLAAKIRIARNNKIQLINKLKNTNYTIPSNEREISSLFDSLKKEYGSRIFGKGFIYKIIDDNLIYDFKNFKSEFKVNGISSSLKVYVQYDKGDKDGNRWYLDNPFVINWSAENVKILKNNSHLKGNGGSRWQGHDFFLEEGFVYIYNKTVNIKARIKEKSINDVAGMSFYSQTERLPNYYLVSVLNSKIASTIIDNFINHTANFQLNDCKDLIIPIPDYDSLNKIKIIFDFCVNTQRDFFAGKITKNTKDLLLKEKQSLIDNLIQNLYFKSQ